MTRGHGYDGVIDKLLLESMGDHTKERDHARPLSRVDEVLQLHQFFELPCLLLPGHTRDHHRIVIYLWHPRYEGWDNVFLLESCVFQVKQLSYIFITHIFVFQCIQKTCLEVRNEKLKAKNQTLLMIYKTENVYYYSFVYCVFICNVE